MYMEVATFSTASGCLITSKKHAILDTVLIFCSVGGTITGLVLSSAYDPIAGTGFLLAGVSSACLAYTVRTLRLSKSLASSAQVLSVENDELRASNDELRNTVETVQSQLDDFAKQNGELSKIADELSDDLSILRGAIGAVGGAGNDIMNRLRNVWKSLQTENNRHAQLIKAQTRLQLVQIMQHYDTNTDALLDDVELAGAKAYLHAAFPDADIGTLVERARNSDVTFDDLLEVLR